MASACGDAEGMRDCYEDTEEVLNTERLTRWKVASPRAMVSIVEEREKGYDRFEGISLLNHFEEISLLSPCRHLLCNLRLLSATPPLEMVSSAAAPLPIAIGDDSSSEDCNDYYVERQAHCLHYHEVKT
ncbi:hypothetical protein GW17_00023462 [Ensete ventricosum]|nr:hypothetical protein GW17_00023462 [Ensete ventricosum]